MAWDDPVVWILIIAAVVFLFGASRIPQFARSLGQARKEFEKGSRGEPATNPPATVTVAANSPSADDPLVVAAQKEGIDTQGKTKEQIASELSWKLNKK
jgi:sec-independent protein translocase protein TatA